MPRHVIVAAAWKTPLYLPLYVARERRFFGFLPDFEITIEENVDPRRNGDEWAIRRVAERVAAADVDVKFAVCDPVNAYRLNNTRVVATLVQRAAFWAVDRDTVIANTADFKSFEKLFTYPVGMSAYWIAKAAERACGKQGMVEAVEIDTELEKSVGTPNTVAMTADIIKAMRYANAGKVRINYKWSDHGTFSHFMLTGLVTTSECINNDPVLVTGMIRALRRAILDIKMKQPVVAETLVRHFGATPAEALEVLARFNEEDLYPENLVPERSSWHHAHSIYARAKGESPSEAQSHLHWACVDDHVAKEVHRAGLKKLYLLERLNPIDLMRLLWQALRRKVFAPILEHLPIALIAEWLVAYWIPVLSAALIATVAWLALALKGCQVITP